VGEAEVQPFVPLIFRRVQIMVLLLLTHSVPNLVASFVPPNIVTFNKDSHHDIPAHKGKKNFVSLPIEGCIISSVYLTSKQRLAPEPNTQMQRNPESARKRTLEEMIEPAWQIMLYNALPTVRVRTEPELRETRLTITETKSGNPRFCE
jgi:hypothetical protein